MKLVALAGGAAWAVAVSWGAEPSWKLAYFYDQDAAGLSLHELQWAGPNCALALGVEQSARSRPRPVSVVSRDSGQTWTATPLKNYARSATLLNERLGWIVTEDGLERTSDCGQTWEKSGREKGLLRVWFRDEALGWAVGAPKKALATRDGGTAWKAIEAIDPPSAKPDRSLYSWVEFGNEKQGVMVGWHEPERSRRGQRFPEWMDPEDAALKRQWPALTLMLQTLDGGATWKGLTASLMGRIQRVRMAPDGAGLAIVEFDTSFDYPSEVYGIGVGKAEARRIYRDKTHFVTDVALGQDGWIYLAGVDVPGSIRLPVPGKVRILRSRDLTNWDEMKVDYRASATRVWMAASPKAGILAATDTGMILRLTGE